MHRVPICKATCSAEYQIKYGGIIRVVSTCIAQISVKGADFDKREDRTCINM